MLSLMVRFAGPENPSDLSPGPGGLEPEPVHRGLGLDPVFQTWSHLWTLEVTGEENQYYNVTQVHSQHGQIIRHATTLHAAHPTACTSTLLSGGICFCTLILLAQDVDRSELLTACD